MRPRHARYRSALHQRLFDDPPFLRYRPPPSCRFLLTSHPIRSVHLSPQVDTIASIHFGNHPDLPTLRPDGTNRTLTDPIHLDIEHYTHVGKDRATNPPVGLVTPETDRDAANKPYTYDPHIDPALQWAGKAERTSFEIPTVSLHVHERIDPRSIIEAVRT